MKKKQIIQIIRKAADLQADAWIVHDDKLVVSCNHWFLSCFVGGGSRWDRELFGGMLYVQPLFDAAAAIGSRYCVPIEGGRGIGWSLEFLPAIEIAAELHEKLAQAWQLFRAIATPEGFVANARAVETRKRPLRFDPFWPLELDLARASVVIGRPYAALDHLARARQGLDIAVAAGATIPEDERDYEICDRLAAAVEAGDGSSLATLEAIREDNVQRLGIAEICH